MKALILLSSLGVIAMLAEIFNFKKLLFPLVIVGLVTTFILNVFDWNINTDQTVQFRVNHSKDEGDVGAGITADSHAEEEYRECVLKGTFATAISPLAHRPFSLLETMRLQDGIILRLERHVLHFGDHLRQVQHDLEAAGAIVPLLSAHHIG